MGYFILVCLVVICDQATKYAIVSTFSLYDYKVIVPGFFHLTYVTNPGAAFSFLADVEGAWPHYFFLTIGSVAVIVLSVILYQTRKQSLLQSVGLSLIIGGALGNLIDRILRGEVVDFLDFFYGTLHWPAFNVADMAICSGVAGVIIVQFLYGKRV